MKRFITVATSALVLAVGGTMLASPVHAATTTFSCTEEDLADAQFIADDYCGGRFSEAYVTCSGGMISMDVTC